MRTGCVLLVAFCLIIPGGPSHADEPDSNLAIRDLDEVDSGLSIGPLMLGSFGLVAVAVGGGFGCQAYQGNKDFNEEVTDDQGVVSYPQATDALADDIEDHALTANILMFGGAAIAIGGLIWWLVDRRGSEKIDASEEADTALSIYPTLGPGTAGVRVRF